MRVLTADAEVRYLSAASPFLRDVAILVLETGMRPGEVCQLRANDVDLKEARVYVRQGKTNYTTRHIPLTQRAAEVLSQRLNKARSEWLFPCPYDLTRPVAEVRKAQEAALRRSGITPPSGFTTCATPL